MEKLSAAPPVGAAISTARPPRCVTTPGLAPSTFSKSLRKSSTASFTGPGASGRSMMTISLERTRLPPTCAEDETSPSPSTVNVSASAPGMVLRMSFPRKAASLSWSRGLTRSLSTSRGRRSAGPVSAHRVASRYAARQGARKRLGKHFLRPRRISSAGFGGAVAILLGAGCPEARQAVAVQHRFPDHELLQREAVAPARFVQGEQAAIDRGDDFGLATDDPARRAGRRQIRHRQGMAIRPDHHRNKFAAVTSHALSLRCLRDKNSRQLRAVPYKSRPLESG